LRLLLAPDEEGSILHCFRFNSLTEYCSARAMKMGFDGNPICEGTPEKLPLDDICEKKIQDIGLDVLIFRLNWRSFGKMLLLLQR
jgi:hypothetical protein